MARCPVVQAMTIFVLMFSFLIGTSAHAQFNMHAKSCFDKIGSKVSSETLIRSHCVLHKRPARMVNQGRTYLNYFYNCSENNEIFYYNVSVDFATCDIKIEKILETSHASGGASSYTNESIGID